MHHRDKLLNRITYHINQLHYILPSHCNIIIFFVDKDTMLIVILSVILSTTILIGTFVAVILCFKQGKLKCKPLNKSLKTHGTSSTVSRSVQEATSNRTNLVNNKDSNESFRMQSVNKIFLQRLPKIGECKTETDNEIFEIDLPTGRANALPPINTKLQ